MGASILIPTPPPSKTERTAQRVVLKKKRKLVRTKIVIRKERKLILEPPGLVPEPVVSGDAFETVFEPEVEREIRRKERRLTTTRKSLERVQARARRRDCHGAPSTTRARRSTSTTGGAARWPASTRSMPSSSRSSAGGT
jgi:hypothetical protein